MKKEGAERWWCPGGRVPQAEGMARAKTGSGTVLDTLGEEEVARAAGGL